MAKFSTLVNRFNVSPMVTGFVDLPSFNNSKVINLLDSKGNLWSISTTDEARAIYGAAVGRTNLLFNDDSASEAMNIVSVYGEALVTSAINFSDFKSNKKLRAWLKETKDHDYVAIKMVPDEACFWDAAKNDYITLFKLENNGVIALETEVMEAQIAMSA